MNIITQVKCRRCGESFSSLRATCPYCGTRRTAQSTRSPSATPVNNSGKAAASRADNNMKWQLIFGLILVVAVILAVIVMVSTGLSGADSSKVHTAVTPSQPVVTDNAQPTPESAPTPPPTPTPQVQKIDIRYVTTSKTDIDFTMIVGDKLQLNAQAWPADLVQLSDIRFSSSNEDIVKLTDNGDGTCDLECLDVTQNGVPVIITAECFGVTAKTMVYCKTK